MKKFILNTIALILPCLLITACLFEEKEVFDTASAQRMADEIAADISLLTSAPNGWIVDYYAEDYSMGGYAMHWNSLSDGTVAVACEVAVNDVPAATAASSLWNVKADQAPLLSFDTYNAVLQFFCEPSQSDIDGLDGDYEFIIRRNIDMGDNLVVTGKRNGNKMILRPLGKDDDPTTYLKNVKKIVSQVAPSRNFNFNVAGSTIGTLTFSNATNGGLTIRGIDMEIDLNAGGETTTLDTALYFTYTPTGFRFNEAVTLGDLTMQNFVWDNTAKKYTCSDEGVSVEWVCTDDPPKYNYEGFIGDYTLTYGGTGIASNANYTYYTLDVSISEEVTDESYIIKGLLQEAYDDLYTIRLRYDPAAGLALDAQSLDDLDASTQVWVAVTFWNGSGSYVRAEPSYCSLISTDYALGTGSNEYGTGYSFNFSDNSHGSYNDYIAYGITFRTYDPTATGSSNGTSYKIAACNDQYRCYNMSLVKK